MGEKQGFMTSVVALASQKWGVGGDWPLSIGMGGARDTGPMLRVGHLAILVPVESQKLVGPAQFLRAMSVLANGLGHAPSQTQPHAIITLYALMSNGRQWSSTGSAALGCRLCATASTSGVGGRLVADTALLCLSHCSPMQLLSVNRRALGARLYPHCDH